MARCDKTKRGT